MGLTMTDPTPKRLTDEEIAELERGAHERKRLGVQFSLETGDVLSLLAEVRAARAASPVGKSHSRVDWFARGICPMYPPDEPACITVEQCGDCDEYGCADRLRDAARAAPSATEAEITSVCQRWTAQVEHMKAGILALAAAWEHGDTMETRARYTKPSEYGAALRAEWDRLALESPPPRPSREEIERLLEPLARAVTCLAFELPEVVAADVHQIFATARAALLSALGYGEEKR